MVQMLFTSHNINSQYAGQCSISTLKLVFQIVNTVGMLLHEASSADSYS